MKNLKLLFYKEIQGSFNLKGSDILSLAFFSISIILLSSFDFKASRDTKIAINELV